MSIELPIKDDRFKVEVLEQTPNPQKLCYSAMLQDYGETSAWERLKELQSLSELEFGERVIKNCIKHKHWGVLEHPQITFNVINFPHSVMVQARTHRVGVSFDCQSQRYTGKRIIDCVKRIIDHKQNNQYGHNLKVDSEVEKLFYFRPIGEYIDYKGTRCNYTYLMRESDIDFTYENAARYFENVTLDGYASEHARDMLQQNIRQHFVVSFNLRSLLHFCDMRTPLDAQPEIRTMALMLLEKSRLWCPEIVDYYIKTRLSKNKLAP